MWRSIRNRSEQLSAWLVAQSPVRVLAFFVVSQWLVVAGLAAQVRHKGWIFYMGGDQLSYYTTGWLLGHGHFPPAGVGYLLPALEAPLALSRGPNLVQALPFIIVVNVAILLPIALFALYGIATRIGGRLFGYWTLSLWILVPLLGIPFANAGYHQKYTELTLPQALGLTALADFPTLVATLVSVYFCAKILFDARPRLLDAVAAGAAGGAAVAFKPSASLFLFGPALAFLFGRRFRYVTPFIAGIAPSAIALSLWKLRGFGHIPLVGAYRSIKLAAGPAMTPLVGVNLHRYVNLDWSHFGNNLDLLREHFWSGRLLQWLAVAGAIGLAIRSSRAFFLIVGWFALVLVIRWTRPNASIEDASLLRLMIPTYPAFVLMLAAIPLLFPRVARRLRSESGGLPSPRANVRRGLVALTVVVTAVAPLAAIAVASPVHGPTPLAGFQQTALIPTNIGIGLRARTTATNLDVGLRAGTIGTKVSLSWTATHAIGGPVFYKVFRGPPAAADEFRCNGDTAQRCNYQGVEIGVVSRAAFVDYAPIGTWAYRVGVGANWLNDPSAGDIYVLSKHVLVTTG